MRKKENKEICANCFYLTDFELCYHLSETKGRVWKILHPKKATCSDWKEKCEKIKIELN